MSSSLQRISPKGVFVTSTYITLYSWHYSLDLLFGKLHISINLLRPLLRIQTLYLHQKFRVISQKKKSKPIILLFGFLSTAVNHYQIHSLYEADNGTTFHHLILKTSKLSQNRYLTLTLRKIHIFKFPPEDHPLPPTKYMLLMFWEKAYIFQIEKLEGNIHWHNFINIPYFVNS